MGYRIGNDVFLSEHEGDAVFTVRGRKCSMDWKLWAGFGVLLVAGFLYMVWLDYGCAISGVITWGGKMCI